jgi:hypothetical protein
VVDATEAPGETEQQVRDFRSRLRDAGFHRVNATNELGTDELVVSTGVAGREWTVAVKPAQGSTEQRQDLIRVRLNPSAGAEANARKLAEVWQVLGLA